MNFDNVLYDSISGVPYYISIIKTGPKKGKIVKHHGCVRYCIKCGTKFFAPHQYTDRGEGKFCSSYCSNSYHPEIYNKRWKGGRRKDGKGYIRIMLPDHPDGDERGYVWEHRIVVESYLKRRLGKNEVIHHINQKPSDNRIENLRAMKRGEHLALHRKLHTKKRAI